MRLVSLPGSRLDTAPGPRSPWPATRPGAVRRGRAARFPDGFLVQAGGGRGGPQRGRGSGRDRGISRGTAATRWYAAPSGGRKSASPRFGHAAMARSA